MKQLSGYFFSSTNQDRPTFWAWRIFILDVLFFLDFLDSRFPDFQTVPAPSPPEEPSDPKLTPLPTYLRIKYVARSQGPLLRVGYKTMTGSPGPMNRSKKSSYRRREWLSGRLPNQKLSNPPTLLATIQVIRYI